jgi:hypothetical protein
MLDGILQKPLRECLNYCSHDSAACSIPFYKYINMDAPLYAQFSSTFVQLVEMSPSISDFNHSLGCSIECRSTHGYLSCGNDVPKASMCALWWLHSPLKRSLHFRAKILDSKSDVSSADKKSYFKMKVGDIMLGSFIVNPADTPIEKKILLPPEDGVSAHTSCSTINSRSIFEDSQKQDNEDSCLSCYASVLCCSSIADVTCNLKPYSIIENDLCDFDECKVGEEGEEKVSPLLSLRRSGISLFSNRNSELRFAQIRNRQSRIHPVNCGSFADRKKSPLRVSMSNFSQAGMHDMPINSINISSSGSSGTLINEVSYWIGELGYLSIQ